MMTDKNKTFVFAEGQMWAMKGFARRKIKWYEWIEAIWKGWEICR